MSESDLRMVMEYLARSNCFYLGLPDFKTVLYGRSTEEDVRAEVDFKRAMMHLHQGWMTDNASKIGPLMNADNPDNYRVEMGRIGREIKKMTEYFEDVERTLGKPDGFQLLTRYRVQ